MKRHIAVAVLTLLAVGAARAADTDAILDKAAQALGGKDKLGRLKAVETRGKGKINFGGNEIEYKNHTITQGLDHYRSEFEGNFGGMEIKGVTVVAGNKGWRKFGDMNMELDEAGLGNEKRTIYLQSLPLNPVALKNSGFKLELVGEEKVGDKPAVCLKVTPADGRDFKVCYDKETGLPLRAAAKVVGFMGEEFTQETNYSNYKDVDGVKRPMKSENKRDGEKFLDLELEEFKILEKVDPKTFSEPQ